MSEIRGLVELEGVSFRNTTILESGLQRCISFIDRGENKFQFDKDRTIYDLKMGYFIISYTKAKLRDQDLSIFKTIDIQSTTEFQQPRLCGEFEYNGNYCIIISAQKTLKGLNTNFQHRGLIINPQGYLDSIGLNDEIFKRFPKLIEELRTMENVSIEDILGKGNYGLTLDLGNGTCLKIGLHEDGKRLLINEPNFHQRFYQILERGKIEGKVPDWIKIPRLIESEGKYCMEIIKGQTVKTKQLRIRYANLLQNEDQKYLDSLTDFQFERLLEDKYGIERDIIDTMTMNGPNALEEISPEKVQGVRETLEYFKANGLIHIDLHNSNIMIADNGCIYIIDFGVVQIDGMVYF